MTNKASRVTVHVKQSTGSYELVLSGVLFGILGFWLDRRLGSTPWLLIAFTLAGFVGAALSVYYRYRAEIERLQAETAELRAEQLRREQDRRDQAAALRKARKQVAG